MCQNVFKLIDNDQIKICLKIVSFDKLIIFIMKIKNTIVEK